MPLSKPRPLQPLAVQTMALVILLVLCSTLSMPHFAYAAGVDSIRLEDHNHEQLLGTDVLGAYLGNLELRGVGSDREITGKAPTSNSLIQLANNVPSVANISQGQTNTYTFPSSELDLRSSPAREGDSYILEESEEGADPANLELRQQRRATTSRAVYISVNVCHQPKPIEDTTTDPPPQLTLYISQDSSNPNPGPNSNGAQQTVGLDEGAAMRKVNATGDIYISLYGPNTTAYKAAWSAQIAASTNTFYHTFLPDNSGQNLYLVDSDSSAALLITGNITNETSSYQAVMNAAPPFVLFASKSNNQSIQGLQNSYCGLLQNAEIAPSTIGKSESNVQASLTTRGWGAPKQQFYLSGINSGTTYYAALAVDGGGNSTGGGPGVIGGGGKVWPMMNFTTLSGMYLPAF